MRHLVSGLIVSLAAFASANAMAWEKPAFPRTAGINWGNPYNYDDPEYQKQLAKLDMTVIKTYPGRPSWNPAIRAIKQLNPNELVFMYVINNEFSDSATTSGTAWDTYRAKIDKMKWWLYTTEGSGVRVKSQFGNDYYILNNTPMSRVDENGMNAAQWTTQYFVTNYYKPNYEIDGFLMDNVFVRPNVNGDWNRDGKTDMSSDPAAALPLRQGYAYWYSTVRKMMPGKLQLGNIGSFGLDGIDSPEYENMVNGGLFEAPIGKSWSVELHDGWNVMMQRYRKIMARSLEPKLVIFNQWGDPKDYKAARYGITSALMDNGYHSFTSLATGYTGVHWFDEYDAKLGQATTIPPTKAWQQGVYRRDFEGGIALVNPKGNGAKTVTLEADFVKLKGNQDPNVNNGATVRTVTIGDRDGIILMRKAPVTKPKPPTFVSR